MEFAIINNEIICSSEAKLSITNRAFLYGDGFFETIKIFSSKAFNLINHYNRIINSARILDLDFNLSVSELEKNVNAIIRKNNIVDGSIRITIFRDSDGKYFPNDNKSSYCIYTYNDTQAFFVLNSDPLLLGVYEDNYKSVSALSSIKSLNSLLYVMASKYAKKNDFDDVLLLNSNKNIIESTNSNIFLCYGDVVYTPPISDGCVDGSMRRLIITLLKDKFTLLTKTIIYSDVVECEELFLSNAISGVRWVGSFGDKEFVKKDVSSYLINALNKLI